MSVLRSDMKFAQTADNLVGRTAPRIDQHMSLWIRRVAAVAAVCLVAPLGHAQVSITGFGSPYTQNFDSLGATGAAWADNTTIPGWYAQFSANAANPTTYLAGTGSTNSGGLYSFGSATVPADRALGSVASGTPGNIFTAIRLVNNTGSTISSLNIAFTGEQWRDGGPTPAVAQTLAFQYQVANAGVISDASTPTGGWTGVSALDFVSPTFSSTATALDGNAAANRSAKSMTVAMTIAPGQEVWLRWQDLNDASNDHGLAIDDFSVSANAAVIPVLTIDPASITEGDVGCASGSTALNFTVHADVAPVGNLGFTFSTTDGSATSGADFTSTGTGSIASGSTTGTATVQVTCDNRVEGDESFTINLTGGGAYTLGSPSSATGTIVDDDVAQVMISDVSADEGNSSSSNFNFVVSLANGKLAGTGGVTLQVDTADGSASAGSDYTAIATGSVSILAGQNSATVSVPVAGDVGVETDETFFVNLSNVTGLLASISDGQGLGTIVNDDTGVPPTVSIADASITEGNSGTSTLNFTVTVTGNPTGDVSLTVNTSGGSATTPSDYTAISNQTLSIPVSAFGVGGATAQVSVSINGDTQVESDETFNVVLSNPVNATISSGTAIGTILNDDVLPVVTLSGGAVLEGNGGTQVLNFTVTATGTPSGDITLVANTADGSATAGSDYTAVVSQTVTIPAASFSGGVATAQVPVTISGDTVVEPNESFTLTLSAPVNATIDTATASGTIRNDDAYPQLSIADAAIVEGNSGTSVLNFTVAATGTPSGDITFKANTAGITADGNVDYDELVNLVVTIPAASFSAGTATVQVPVTIHGDTAVESDETFSLSITTPVNADVISGSDIATGTIQNDDAAPSLTIADASIVEGNSGTSTLNFTVTATGTPGGDISFTVDTVDDTAVAGMDYTALVGQVVTLPAASFSGGTASVQVPVTILGDTVVEPNESFVVALSNPVNATIASGDATGTITNDDTFPTVSIASASIAEGNSGTAVLNFTVTATGAPSGDITLTANTADGSATAGSDYVALSAQTVTIPAASFSGSSATVQVPVTINGDSTIEPNETFTITLSAPVNAVLGTATATGTIANDDASLSIASPAAITEGNTGSTPLNFTVTLSTALATDVAFTATTANGTATGGASSPADYGTLAAAPFTITAGTTSATVPVAIFGDVTVESTETFTVSIATSAGGVTVSGGPATGTILDDDIASTPISQVQGSAATSTLVGQNVTVNAIVTARVADGFYVQSADADADADPNTSEGLFVFTGSAPSASIDRGVRIAVGGTVAEASSASGNGGQTVTQLVAPLTLNVLSSGNPLPTPVDLTTSLPAANGGIAQLERLENMRVRVPAFTVVGASEGTVDEVNASATSTGRFVGVVSGVARPFRESGLAPEDFAAGGYAAPIPAADGNPERIAVDSIRQRSVADVPRAAIEVDSGAALANLTGVLDYNRRGFRLSLDTGAFAAPTGGMLPVATTAPAAREVTVGNYDLGRFLNATSGDGSAVTLTGSAYMGRLDKAAIGIVDYLNAPDILGVEGVENYSTLLDLSAAISNYATAHSLPDPRYLPRLDAGTDSETQVGFLMKQSIVTGTTPRVSEVGHFPLAYNDKLLCPDNSQTGELLNNPPALYVDTVVHTAAGASYALTAIVARLLPEDNINSTAPATISCFGTLGNQVRRTRQQQAASLAAVVQGMQVAAPGRRIVVLGGFNASELNDGWADTVGTVAGVPSADNTTVVPADGADLVQPDLIVQDAQGAAAERYSEVVDGNAQATSHLLIGSAAVASVVTKRVERARINADFGEAAWHSAAGMPMRVSGHDPLLAFLEPEAFYVADLTVSGSATPNPVNAGAVVAYQLSVHNNGSDTALAPQLVFTLPANASLSGAISPPAGWSCSNTGTPVVVTCNAASLANGATAIFTINVTIPVSASGTVTAPASMSAHSTDLVNGNSSANIDVVVTAAASLLFKDGFE